MVNRFVVECADEAGTSLPGRTAFQRPDRRACRRPALGSRIGVRGLGFTDSEHTWSSSVSEARLEGMQASRYAWPLSSAASTCSSTRLARSSPCQHSTCASASLCQPGAYSTLGTCDLCVACCTHSSRCGYATTTEGGRGLKRESDVESESKTHLQSQHAEGVEGMYKSTSGVLQQAWHQLMSVKSCAWWMGLCSMHSSQ